MSTAKPRRDTNRSCIQDYLQSVGRYAVLEEEQQLLHAKNVHRWINDPAGQLNAPPIIKEMGERSLQLLTNTNLRLVIKVAKSYQNRGLDLMDLIQEGNLGLITGLKKYDPTKGYKVSTYVYWWIRQNIGRCVLTKGRMIHLPVNLQEELQNYNRCVQDFITTQKQAPTDDEVATCLGITLKRVKELRDYKTTAFCDTLDLTYEQGNPVHQIAALPDPDNILAESDLRAFQEDLALVKQFIQRLDFNESYVIEEIFFAKRTHRDIGFDLNVTGPRIAQIQSSALKKMRKMLAETQD